MGIENNNSIEYKVKSGDSLTKIVVLKYGKDLGFPMDTVKGDKINWKNPAVKAFLKDSNISSSFWNKVNELYSQTKDFALRQKKGEDTKITYETWTGFDTPKSKLKKEKNRFSLLTGEKLKLEQLRNELDPNSYINEALPISKVESPLEKTNKTDREKAIGETQNTIENGDSDKRKEAVDIALKIPTGAEAEKLSDDKKLAIEDLEKGLYGSEIESPEDDTIKSMIKDQKVGVDSLAFGVDREGIDSGNGEDDATMIIKANDDLKYNLSIKNENSYKFDPISQKFVKVGENETKEYLTNSHGKDGILEVRSFMLINRILHQMYINHEVENNLIKDSTGLYSQLIHCDEKKLRTIANWRDNQDYGRSEYFSRFHSSFGSDVPTEILLDTYETINNLESIKDKDGKQKYTISDIVWEKGKDDIYLEIKNNETGEKKEIKFDERKSINEYMI